MTGLLVAAAVVSLLVTFALLVLEPQSRWVELLLPAVAICFCAVAGVLFILGPDALA